MQPPKGGRATTTEGRKSNHCHQKKDGQFHNEKEGHQREEAQPPPPKVACVPSVRNPCAHSLEVVSSHPLPKKNVDRKQQVLTIALWWVFFSSGGVGLAVCPRSLGWRASHFHLSF